MTPEFLCVLILFAIVIHQQVCIHKLINKVMSRNYHEYQTTVNSKEEANSGLYRVKVDTDVPEDLRALQEYGLR